MQSLDSALFTAIHNLANQLNVLDWLIIFTAKYLAYFLVAGFFILLFLEKDWRKRFYDFSLASLSVILSWGIVTEIIRFIYFRPRPFVALGFEPLFNHSAAEAAFPSGHAAFFFALAFAVFFINKKIGILYIAAAVLMGFARVMAGVHWPLDILAGALFSFLSVFVVRWILSKAR